ncbi:hypothetical protein Pme01_37230 [Planosporangium mesophilum]|uniref:Uncharacterized protein n=1 Tax=Planosporangium mesophilum TaxID=689768 RepID=A0A8J3X1T1_9ACTN|nr:hypothetical protein Pme01_37230 [Planosporangium mesophilum]
MQVAGPEAGAERQQPLDQRLVARIEGQCPLLWVREKAIGERHRSEHERCADPEIGQKASAAGRYGGDGLGRFRSTGGFARLVSAPGILRLWRQGGHPDDGNPDR